MGDLSSSEWLKSVEVTVRPPITHGAPGSIERLASDQHLVDCLRLQLKALEAVLGRIDVVVLTISHGHSATSGSAGWRGPAQQAYRSALDHIAFELSTARVALVSALGHTRLALSAAASGQSTASVGGASFGEARVG